MREWLSVLLLVWVSLAITWWVTDGPLPSHPIGEGRVAAVAIRDHVIPFQKFGTKLFTLPTLHYGYDQVTYLTESSHGEKREAFVEAVERAASEHDRVDLWILAHGNRIVFWLYDLSDEARSKLRLVYNTGCANAYQAELWHRHGVQTYVGHPGRTSVSPVYYVFFARRWVRGWNAEAASADANLQTARRLELFGWLTLGLFDGAELARETTGVVTGEREVTLR